MTTPKPTPFVMPSTTKRDATIAVVVGLIVLGFVGYGVTHMSQPVAGNKLTGTVTAKVFTPLPEHQVSFSGTRLEGVKDVAGDYLLKVRVDAENRTYEVPVDQPLYDSKKVGDSVTFIRPRSEQH